MSDSKDKLIESEKHLETRWDETAATSGAIAEDLSGAGSYTRGNTEEEITVTTGENISDDELFDDEDTSRHLPEEADDEGSHLPAGAENEVHQLPGGNEELPDLRQDLSGLSGYDKQSSPKEIAAYEGKLQENIAGDVATHSSDVLQHGRDSADVERNKLEAEQEPNQEGQQPFLVNAKVSLNEKLTDLNNQLSRVASKRSHHGDDAWEAKKGSSILPTRKMSAIGFHSTRERRSTEASYSVGAQDSSDWFDGVPPSIFPYLSVIPDKVLPEIVLKRKKELLCDQLDMEQRRLLRDERMARVYYNPVTTVGYNDRSIQPKRVSQQPIKDVGTSADERVQPGTSLDERLKKTCKIYGAKCRLSSKKMVRAPVTCDRIRKLPPYQGPHAYHVTAFEMSRVKPKIVEYQFVNKNIPIMDRISASDFKDLTTNKQLTTPHAIWRQQRFLSPDGCDYRKLKEQLRCAKYKAMLKTLTSFTKEDHVAIGNSLLWQHSVPADSLSPPRKADDEIFVRTPSVEEDSSLAGGRGVGGDLVRKLLRKKVRPLDINGDDLQELLVQTELTRLQLSQFVGHRPKGEFVTDPREDPAYVKRCGKKIKRFQ
ncbi:hypothetical protein Btru_026523 [Bulinus truncatus]|nr:hypothetical protein Btru_026523 [Bulinus truncatus]